MLSQDHIELFFGAIGLSCGSNNNPTVRQFTSAYKRLLMRHDVKVNKGNSSPQDATRILTGASFMNIAKQAVPDESHDMLVARRYNLELQPPVTDDHDYADTPNIAALSTFAKCV